MERGNVRPVYLDGIITVIDCINFQGYEDTSYTARLQAQYTDLVVLNKWQLVTERQLDLVLDRVLELNPDTPYIHADCDARVPIDLILGADHTLTSRRFRSVDTEFGSGTRIEHMSEEVDVLKITVLHCDKDRLTVAALSEFLSDKNALPTDRYYRIKGFLRNHIDNTAVIINWAFGRFSISEPFPITDDRQQSQLELTVIGPSGVLFANDMISMEVDKLFSRAFNGSANITKL
jgi:G3E family GTPase